MSNTIYLYADGSADRQRFGGFAYAITRGFNGSQLQFDYAQGALDTTNSRMELSGVVHGLQMCDTLVGPPQLEILHNRYSHTNPHTQLLVHSDSAYVINCFKERWYRQWIANNWIGSAGPVKNRDLWEELLHTANDMIGHGFAIEWIHVKGHATSYWNNHCDKLAGIARKKIRAEAMSKEVIE